ncbi:hypothetical protein D3C76_1503140 [compost metagenome]
MEGEDNENPGYELLGRLFGVGYITGLMEAAAKMTRGSSTRYYRIEMIVLSGSCRQDDPFIMQEKAVEC